MWRRIKYKYHLQVLFKMCLHISFKSPTVDNLLQVQIPFITFVIFYKWRFGHWVLQIFQIPRLVQCFFFFPHPATELGKHTCVYIYI